MLTTDGNWSLFGPPCRTFCVDTPSSVNDVAVGSCPEIEMLPVASGCTLGARLATTSGLGEPLARKFSARDPISFPDFESDRVRSWLITGSRTSTEVPLTPATVSCASMRTVSRAGSCTSFRDDTANPFAEIFRV